MREYIEEWRKQRRKEEDELQRLKERQVKRKARREEEEKRLAEKRKSDEERRVREIEEKKRADQEEKMRRLEEAEKKRQMMMEAHKQKQGYNAAGRGESGFGAGIEAARAELTKTREQLEEEKKISLSFRIKALDMSGMGMDGLKKKAAELWEAIIKLETEKYDLEERQKRQDYDVSKINITDYALSCLSTLMYLR